jgi:hypothetical protein
MGITITWDNPQKTIIRTVVTAPFTWDELFAGWDTAVEMIINTPHTVHMIVIAQMSGFPPGNVLVQLNRMTTTVPHNTGLAVIVTSSRFIEAINATLFKLSPRLSRRGRVVASLDDAYAVIAAQGIPEKL